MCALAKNPRLSPWVTIAIGSIAIAVFPFQFWQFTASFLVIGFGAAIAIHLIFGIVLNLVLVWLVMFVLMMIAALIGVIWAAKKTGRI